MEYTPKSMPEVKVTYTVDPGQRGNRNQPEIPPEVTITDIEIFGQEISYGLFSVLLSKFADEWSGKILYDLRQKSEEPE